jgi:hypothetical protein
MSATKEDVVCLSLVTKEFVLSHLASECAIFSVSVDPFAGPFFFAHAFPYWSGRSSSCQACRKRLRKGLSLNLDDAGQ